MGSKLSLQRRIDRSRTILLERKKKLVKERNSWAKRTIFFFLTEEFFWLNGRNYVHRDLCRITRFEFKKEKKILRIYKRNNFLLTQNTRYLYFRLNRREKNPWITNFFLYINEEFSSTYVREREREREKKQENPLTNNFLLSKEIYNNNNNKKRNPLNS